MAPREYQRAGSSKPVQWGLWLLPVAAFVPVIVFTVWTAIPSDLDTDPRAAAQAAAGAPGLVTGGLYIVALLAMLLGLQALYGWLATGRARPWALAGLTLSVASIGLLLAAFGAFILAGAIVAAVYLNRGASDILDALRELSGGSFGPPILVTYVAAIALAVAGGVCNGIALWRASTLPRWLPLIFGIGFILFALSAPVVTQVGGTLLAIAGAWMARSAGQTST